MSDSDDPFEIYAKKHGISREDAVDLACILHAEQMANAQMERLIGMATRHYGLRSDLVAAVLGAKA